MEFFYCLNMMLFVFLSCVKVYYTSKYFKMGFVNPISISFLVFTPVLIFKVFAGPAFLLDDGLFNQYFNYAIFLTNVSLLVDFLLTVLIFKVLRKRSRTVARLNNIIKPLHVMNRKKMILLSFGYFILFLLIFYLLANHSFGLVNWIRDPRSGYQWHRVGVGYLYALSLLFLSTSFTLLTVYTKSLKLNFVVFLAFLPFVYLFGSKGTILSFVVYFSIILWFRRYKYLKLSIYSMVCAVFVLMLINFGHADIIDIVSYFDYYKNSAMYFKEYFDGNIDLFYGKIWLTDFYSYVPRSIFPDKPFVYGFLHVNEHFFPGAAEATDTPAFGGPVSSFADFGFIGVIVFALFNIYSITNSILIYLLYQDTDFRHIQSNSNRLYLFIWMLAPMYMAYFPSFISIILFIFIIKSVSVSNRLTIATHPLVAVAKEGVSVSL